MATPGKYHFKPVAYGFQKDSPFLPLFNYNLNKMKERGSLKQIQVKYESQPKICPNKSGDALGFISVISLFWIIIPGVGITWIVFGLEKITQAYGMKWYIFNSYGIVDNPDEFYENDTAALLTENASLKKQILQLKKLENSPWKSPKDNIWTD